MKIPRLLLVAPLTALATLLHAATAKLADFAAAAESHRVVLALPDYPRTVEQLRTRGAEATRNADAMLAALAKQDAAALTFANTFAAYDKIVGDVSAFGDQANTIAESNPEKAVRDAARELRTQLDAWRIGLDYRDDVYRVLKAFADTHPKLDPQEQRLVDFTLRDYRRAGLALAPGPRQQVEQLRKQLSALEQEFKVNINQATAPLDFTAAELAGVPDTLLKSPGVPQPDGRYRVMANITWHAVAIYENADRAETRRTFYLARNRLAAEKNVPVFTQLVALRTEIAHQLGYGTWADYQTETRMAKNGAAALKFEEDLVAGLQPKLAAELETLRQLKAAQTGDAAAKLDPWDISYYQNRLKKERYAVDAEQLRVYFPYQATLDGMFRIYQRIFGLKFTEIDPPYVWFPGVQLFVVTDAATGEPMGSFYLDMFPREGKYNHFACFQQLLGRVLPDGRYELPVAALLCNFPPSGDGKPSLLQHDDVETLFHEFGHVMHAMLSRARFQRQESFNVPQDFVEAPSQMLENWVWDKAVLDTFAADYRDPAKKIPAVTIAALTAAREATDGYLNRRQLALGLLDLAVHTHADASKPIDVVGETNAVLARVTIPPAPDTAFIAYFGHMADGYDAGYYGYLWSKVIAIDMASEFKKAPDGFLDVKVGRRLRDEVYAAGDTRDVAVSVEKFLGRPRSTAPFLEYVGIKH
ncbi:MAG TPA: M3 family metallopeptidase [Opitutaceae bacterium]|nr:M3 family metallopeptidase [Opitutaceae bacterium]